MCILCVIQRCSRRVATMLPWLVIPLIGLWALSQLLPPPFRFEITSPRIACVSVLLVTLFWYEVLMPWLSAWRVRRNAMLRERKRCEAIELQKLRKTATRRCRNCLTPYRDQNPGAGKFMCSYCGHLSKRPVLDFPVPPGMGASGILKELVGKGGKILNGKVWSDNGWMCGQDWLENGNSIGRTLSGKSSYWKNNNAFFGDLDHCVTDKSYSCIFLVAFKAIISVIFSIMWLWRKIFRFSSSEDDVTDAERREILDKQGENGVNGQVSRVEKARRKAEEKRLARLEKELLEDEEKKQREEVTRLVEEQRRLRDEILEAEKPRGKISPCGKEIDTKKEGEKKRQEIKKERDRLSSKSNSDAEEFEKRERNKKSESDRREQHRSSPESKKAYCTEVGHVFKGAFVSSQNKGNAGTRYFDRMKGTLLSSSRAFTGGGLFGKSSNTTSDPRQHRPNIFVDHAARYRKDMVQPDSAHGRLNVKGDEKSVSRHTPIEPQSCTAPKRSWQQLFTRSTAASLPSDSNVIGRPNGKCQAEVQSPPFSSQHASTQLYDKSIGLPSPIAPPSFTLGSTSSSSRLPLSNETMFPRIGDMSVKILPEESEIFEDSCYVPDPTFRVGPIYEPIGNYQLDVGFMTDSGLRTPFAVKTVSGPSEVTKPSPIESPVSRSRVSEERHPSYFLFPNTSEAQDNSNTVMETGVWQMWSSCPLGQDSLGLGGGSVSWLLPPEIRKEDNINPVPHKTMASLFKKDEKVISGTHSPQHVMLANCQNIGKFNTFVPAPVGGPLFPEIPFGSTSIYNNQILLKQDEAAWRSLSDVNSRVSSYNHQSEMSTANCWAKKEWTVQDSRDGVGNSPISKPPHIGGLFTPPDVQSLWSYDLKSKEK